MATKQQIVEQAAQWFAQKHSGEPWTDAQQQAFDAWLQAKPEHARTWERMQKMWGDFDEAQAREGAVALAAGLQASEQRRQHIKTVKRRGGSVLAVLVATGLAWVTLQSENAQVWLADHHSGTGVVEVIELADKSQITLGADSAINVRYENGERHIELLRGDVLVNVAQDSGSPSGQTRPFVVATRHGTAQAMGTQYIVSYRSKVPPAPAALATPETLNTAGKSAEQTTHGSTRVTVLESTVKACSITTQSPTSAAAANCAILQPGEAVQMDDAGLHPVENADAAAASAWTRGQLVVDNQPLTQVLRELERYRKGYILFDAQQLANVRISGVFDLHDTDKTLQALASSAPIQIHQSSPWTVSVKLR